MASKAEKIEQLYTVTHGEALKADLGVLLHPGTTNLYYGARGAGKSKLVVFLMERIIEYFPSHIIITNMMLWPRKSTDKAIIRRFDGEESPEEGGGPIIEGTRIIRCFRMSDMVKCICLQPIGTTVHLFLDEGGNIFSTRSGGSSKELEQFQMFSDLARKFEVNENIITPRKRNVAPYYRDDPQNPGITNGFINIRKNKINIYLAEEQRGTTWKNDIKLTKNQYPKLRLDYFWYDSYNPSGFTIDVDVQGLYGVIGQYRSDVARVQALNLVDAFPWPRPKLTPRGTVRGRPRKRKR